jgi:glycosyltransferase involved in cell wall biosynthesis
MYRDCDIAVVPSVMPEEFSLVCVEAQSMRLPVIATGPGGASEVIVDGETGLIIPTDDAGALTKALASLADDPERRATMGRLGRERMEALFSRAPFGQRMRDLCLETARLDR